MRQRLDEFALIQPEWPAPASVSACITTRAGGCSGAPYAALNLAYHVGDDPHAVARNRALLAQTLGVHRWQWLDQVHGAEVARVGPEVNPQARPPAVDGSITTEPGLALSILTADCLPLLLCDLWGTEVAVAHAGWRGLAAGIIERVVNSFRAPPAELLVYLGPVIKPPHFEVDGPVWEAFARNSGFPRPASAFSATAGKPGRWQCDLAALARQQLTGLGVDAVYGGDLCAYGDPRFYSFRREGVTGRFASLIWRT